jgi:hypothetical protein
MFCYILTDLIPLSALLFSFWYGLTTAKKRISKVIKNRNYSVPTSWGEDDNLTFFEEDIFDR